MSELVETRQDSRRGCGWRRPGLYMTFDGPASSCGKLPIPLERCPTCSGGIKPTRGWTWVEAGPLFAAKECTAEALEACFTCHLAGSILGRVGLLWIGGKFYSTPDEFNREAATQGISRRISAVPRDFVVGETWVLLAHREALKETCSVCGGLGHSVNKPDAECGGCKGQGFTTQAAIFAVFKPSTIEYVVKGDETEDDLKALRARGITPVKVERVYAEGEEENEHPKTPRGTKARPSAGSKTGRVWEIADGLCSNGNLPTRREVVLASVAEGINEATAGTQYPRWLKSKVNKPQQSELVPMPELRVNYRVSRLLPRKPHKKREREYKDDYVVMIGEAANMDDPKFHNYVAHGVNCKYPAEEGWTLEGFAPVVNGDAGEREVLTNG